jgi:hypothetical protein
MQVTDQGCRAADRPRRSVRYKSRTPHFRLCSAAFLGRIMVIYVTMVYGPIAAFLVELFPTKIRYTSMSLP